MNKQTKKGSILEACTNTAIGYTISFALNYFMHWFYDLEISTAQNLGMGAVFTVVSVIRSYVVRRVYNHFGWFQEGKNHIPDTKEKVIDPMHGKCTTCLHDGDNYCMRGDACYEGENWESKIK